MSEYLTTLPEPVTIIHAEGWVNFRLSQWVIFGLSFTTSLHEAGFAVDVDWSEIPESKRKTVVENAKAAGLSWGGKFRDPDPVHFYKEVPGGRGNRPIYIEQAQEAFAKGVGSCDSSCP